MKRHQEEGAKIIRDTLGALENDVYEALRSKRHYKEGFSAEKAVAIIRENRGTQFDPYITDIFLEHIEEMEAVFIQNS